jgi:hypothetical protein
MKFTIVLVDSDIIEVDNLKRIRHVIRSQQEGEKGDSGMKNPKWMLMNGLLIIWMIFTFMVSDSEANPDVYYGNVVATEGKTIQVKGKDGRVSVFWLGHRTRFDTRAPFIGDRVKIEYVKDKLKRNAVTRVTILAK